MKKTRIIIMIAMIAVMVFSSVSVVSAASFPSLTDNGLYKVKHYRSGDCNLSANTYMIKRKAILLKDANYKNVKNDTDPNKFKGGAGSVRNAACYNGSYPYNYNDVKGSYTIKVGNRKYTIESGRLTGSAAKKEKKIKSLLASHPEGIVVWGGNCSSYGPHAILAARVSKKGNIKYIDSAHNTQSNSTKWRGYNSRMNKGEESIGGTIVRGIGSLDRYWYIDRVR